MHSEHRIPEKMLDPDDIECYFAWQLTTPDIKAYLWTISNCDILELTEVYMMKRTEIWASLEPQIPGYA
ncbi:MAG: hypothetical protein ABI778_04210 [Ignavibacteriota bacterium]